MLISQFLKWASATTVLKHQEFLMNKQKIVALCAALAFVVPAHAAMPGNYYVSARAAELLYKHDHKSRQEKDKHEYEKYETQLIQQLLVLAKQFPVCSWTSYPVVVPKGHLQSVRRDHEQSICHPDPTKFTVGTEHGTVGVSEAHVRWCLCEKEPHVILVQLAYDKLGFDKKTLIDTSKPATERIEGTFPAATVPYYVQYQRARAIKERSQTHKEWQDKIKPYMPPYGTDVNYILNPPPQLSGEELYRSGLA